MAEAKSVPVLFVTDTIVLPGMVVPIALDDAARAAIDAAQASESGQLLIAPRLEDRYPSHGVIAKILQVGRIAGGGTAAVVRGERRAQIGAGASGPGAALWVEVIDVPEAETTDEIRALTAEYKKLLLAMLQRREAWEIIDYVNRLTDPSALADTSGYASYLTNAQKRQLLETADVAERLRVLIDWTSEHLAEVEVSDKIAEDVRDGMEKTQKEFLLRQQLAAIRKELGEGEPDGSDDYRARVEAAELPEKVREAALDPHLAGHRARPALERQDRGLDRPEGRARSSGRRPPRLGRRQGSDRRVPGGPGTPRPARAAGRRRTRFRCGDGAGRSPRRRQDIAGRKRGPGVGPQVRPRRPGRCARRGRDPWAPAHLCGRVAGPDRARDR
jgi:Lon protease-like protein